MIMNIRVKRILAAVFCIAVVLLNACTTPDAAPEPTEITTPAATPSPDPSPTPSPTPAASLASVATTAPEPTISYAGQVICIANEFVNIRSAASADSDITGTFPAGDTADVMSFEDGWAYIVYDGIVGYVSTDYTVVKHTPESPVPTGDWTQILVSPTSYLPEGFEVTLADFETGQVDARILDVCNEMFAAAAEDGVTLQLVDAYRSRERQSALFEEMVSRYTSRGYSRANAETKAATITARPDTSEHQTGLALDIVTPSYTKMNKGFANTDAFKWLNANAQFYGFTMRYPADKVDITGVIYEPWHWRFVGTKAAAAMKQSGQCFEEYLGEAD